MHGHQTLFLLRLKAVASETVYVCVTAPVLYVENKVPLGFSW